jgi:Mrp family chromosome partitioning ATPase
MIGSPPSAGIEGWRSALTDAMAEAPTLTGPPNVAEGKRQECLRRDLFKPGFVDRCGGAFRGLTAPAQRTAVIAVTSPQRREGRSAVAAGLALAIAAQTAERVLLLDLDLAHPTQGRLFGVRSAPGLSDYVEDGRRLRAVPDDDHQLWLLPSGNRGPRPMLEASIATSLYGACRERVRWVVADVAPLLEATEAARWCAAADACLLVGRYRSTTVEALERGARLLNTRQPVGFLMSSDSGLPEWIRRWL